MTDTMAKHSSALLFGSTGLTGAQILASLLQAYPSLPITTISRREPAAASANLTKTLEPDTDKWAPSLAAMSPAPGLVLSAVGTTRGAAGGLANQWKIDHDLNLAIARAAREAGARTFLFVSSIGTRGLVGRNSPYGKMKNGVEDGVRDLGFEQAIILRPGTLLGERSESRPAEWLLQGLFRSLDGIGLKDKMAVEAEVVGRAAAAAVRMAEEGKAPGKCWVLEQADILRLGRDEWEPESAGEGVKPVEQ